MELIGLRTKRLHDRSLAGVVKPGTVSEAIVQYEDITPTLCAIAGGKAPDGLDGKSFLPVLLNKRKENRQYAFGIQLTIYRRVLRIQSGLSGDNRYKLIRRTWRSKINITTGL